jgi:endogenous inhibitor of DNA gyrase (YacG/DUF329 family)
LAGDMRCPICDGLLTQAGNPYRPFCSERCKLVDVDNWLSGRYRIPTAVSPFTESDSTGDEKGELD